MTFGIKPPTPITDAASVPWSDIRKALINRDFEVDGLESDRESSPFVFRSEAKKLERMADQPNLPVCRGCGAGYEGVTDDKPQGKFRCPLCGHDNYWKRISRFVMI